MPVSMTSTSACTGRGKSGADGAGGPAHGAVSRPRQQLAQFVGRVIE